MEYNEKRKKLTAKNKIILAVLSLVILILGVLICASTQNKINILNQISGKNLAANNQDEEIGKVYTTYMMLNQLYTKDDSALSGNKVKITTESRGIAISACNADGGVISQDSDGNVIIPEDGIKLRVEGITKGNTYQIEIENISADENYDTTFKKAVIEVDASQTDKIEAYVKTITTIEEDQEVTNNGSKEKTAIFMYEDENNKIKIQGNTDLKIYYCKSENIDGLTEDELANATWLEYDRTDGIIVEKNCKVYSKSQYEDGKFSEISEIIVNNIDKIQPEINVTTYTEEAEEAFVDADIEDKSTKEYGASGIVAYAVTDEEQEPNDSEYIEVETTSSLEKRIDGIVENGEYYLWVKDKAGNINYSSFEVTNVKEEVVAIILNSPVAELKGTEYKTIKSLMKALEEKGLTSNSDKTIIQIVKDVKNQEILLENENIEIDLNGYTITSESKVNNTMSVNSGKVTIVDNKYVIADYIEDETLANDLSGKYSSKVSEGVAQKGKVESQNKNAISIAEGAELTLGVDDETINIETPIIQAAEKGILNNKGILNYYDGTIIAKSTLEGTTVIEGEEVSKPATDTPKLYDPTTQQTETEGLYQTTLSKVTGIEAVIGKKRYVLIETAIEEANVKQGTSDEQVEIDVVTDITKETSITIGTIKNIKLDLNGYTISNISSSYTLVNSGKLEIIDNNQNNDSTIKGQIKNITGGGISNEQGGNLTITSGNIVAKDYGIQNKETLIVIDGSISSENYGIFNENDGTVQMLGGNIAVNDTSSITESYVYGIYNKDNGTVEIIGGNIVTGSSKGGTRSYAYGVYNRDNGKIQISGGNIEACVSYISNHEYGFSYGIYNEITGILEVIDGNIIGKLIENDYVKSDFFDSECTYGIYNIGTLKLTGGNVTANYITDKGYNNIINIYGVYNEGTVNVEGGDITASVTKDNNDNAQNIYGLYNKGTSKISNGNITANGIGIYSNGVYNYSTGILEITEGTISSTNDMAIYNFGTGKIIIGKKDNNINEKPEIVGKRYGIYNESNSGSIEYYDGKIIGKINAIRGIIDKIEEENEIIINYTEEGEIVTLGKQNEIAYIGDNTSTVYDDLQSAINACEADDKITVLNNFTIFSNEIIIPENKKITLNLNGKIIGKYTAKTIDNKGELIITDESNENSGKIYGYGKNIIYNEGNLLIKNVKIESREMDNDTAEGISCIENAGTMEINDGNITLNNLIAITNENSKGDFKYYTINNTGTLTLTKGTVYSYIYIVKSESENSYAIGNYGIYNKAGTVEVKDGNVKVINSGKGSGFGLNVSILNYGICNEDSGNVKIEGGKISEENMYTVTNNIRLSRLGYAIYNNNTGNMEILGGDIDSLTSLVAYNNYIHSYGIYNLGTIKILGNLVDINGNEYGTYNKGTVELTEGNISSDIYGIYCSGNGTIKMTGGYIRADKYGIYNIESGKIEMTGGTIITYDQESSYGIYNTGKIIMGLNDENIEEIPEIRGADSGIYNLGTFYFYDGIIKALEGKSINGNVTEIAKDCVVKKYKYGETDKYLMGTGDETSVLEKKTYVVEVESTGVKYTSLNEAIENIEETDKINVLDYFQILKNEKTPTIPSDKNITIDFLGHTIETENTIINNGTLKLLDSSTNASGKISFKNGGTGYSKIVTCIKNTGILEIQKINLNIEKAFCYGIYNTDDGKVKLSEVSITALINYPDTNGWEITYGIYSNSRDSVEIINGNITIDCATGYGIFNAGTGNVEVTEEIIELNCSISEDEGGNNSYGIYNTSTGNVKVTGGSIKTEDNNDCYGIENKGSGLVEIANVNIFTHGIEGAYGIINSSTGTLTIEQGSIEVYSDDGSYEGTGVLNNGIAEVNGTNISRVDCRNI